MHFKDIPPVRLSGISQSNYWNLSNIINIYCGLHIGLLTEFRREDLLHVNDINLRVRIRRSEGWKSNLCGALKSGSSRDGPGRHLISIRRNKILLSDRARFKRMPIVCSHHESIYTSKVIIGSNDLDSRIFIALYEQWTWRNLLKKHIFVQTISVGHVDVRRFWKGSRWIRHVLDLRYAFLDVGDIAHCGHWNGGWGATNLVFGGRKGGEQVFGGRVLVSIYIFFNDRWKTEIHLVLCWTTYHTG